MLSFSEIVGHETIKNNLEKAIEANKISHAYIFNGEAGMGKKTLADAFAMSLLCESKENRPCKVCHSCKQVISRNHPDLIYVSHEKPGSIGVDDIREQINDTVSVRPYSSPVKIYVVDEAEKMTVQAQNALLKTIEEPPAYVVILLLTTNQDAFLTTILSRCVQLKLKPLKDSLIKEFLMKEKRVTEVQAEVYTAFARGNLGKAIHLAESQEFREMYGQILNLMKRLKQMDVSEILQAIKNLKEDQLNLKDCLDLMQFWFRDVLMFKVTKDVNLLIFKDEYSSINEISRSSSYEGLEEILTSIEKARVRLDANVNMELTFELMLMVMKEKLG